MTALSIELSPDAADRTDAVLEAACSFLSESWHPRLGLVAFGEMLPEAARSAVEARAEALVAYSAGPPSDWDPGGLPAMIHAWGWEGVRTDLERETGQIELYLYGGASAEEDQAEALDRTLDFLQYHLS